MTDPQALEESLAKMANDLLKDAAKEPKLDIRVDVFKAVANWHVAIRRPVKQTDEGTSFTSMVEKLRGTGT